jgi:DNA-directed RNA polymerase subunit M/transcription elongation factor TFIIS
MSFFNEELIKAMTTGIYICSKCGSVMEFENEWADTLVCQKCGHNLDIERYGFENDEDYDALYPTKEEVMVYAEDEKYQDEEYTGETYDEVCGELSD